MNTTNEQHMNIIESDLERIKARYNPNNDGGQVTWVDAKFVMIIERLLSIVDNLQKSSIAEQPKRNPRMVEVPASLGHLKNNYPLNLESVLCLATLYANGACVKLPEVTVQAADDYYNNLPKGDCGNCPYFSQCLACKINE